MSRPAVRRAAVHGVGILTDGLSNREHIAGLLGHYRAEGGVGPCVLTRWVWVGSTDPTEMEAENSRYRSYTSTGRQASFADGIDRITGSADQVADALGAALAQTGATSLNLRVHAEGALPEHVLEQIALIGAEVLPQVRGHVNGTGGWRPERLAPSKQRGKYLASKRLHAGVIMGGGTPREATHMADNEADDVVDNQVDYDLIIRGGMVVDGSGLPRRRVDVGIKDGKVAKLAHLEGHTATDEIDATGLIVAPGIVDPHTHYDPQITFDPYATMSCFHGVTTVVAGNCGFSMAPIKPVDHDFIGGIFAAVENMDPIALSGVHWNEADTFEEFMEARKGHLGVNFACYVGHSNLRRWVMGADAVTRAATDDEIAQMVSMLHDALEAGAAGISSSAAPTHLDIHGQPVPSRVAEQKEMLALAEELGRWGAGSVAMLPFGAIGGLRKEDEDFLMALGAASGLPVIIQGLGGRNKTDAPTATWDNALDFLDRANDAGTAVFSLLISRPFDRPVVFKQSNLHYLSRVPVAGHAGPARRRAAGRPEGPGPAGHLAHGGGELQP